MEGLQGSKRVKVFRAHLPPFSLGAPPRGSRRRKKRAPPHHPAEPLRALAKGRSDPSLCGSCGWQPVAAPSPGDWQRARGRVAGGILGDSHRTPGLGVKRADGARGAPDLQKAEVHCKGGSPGAGRGGVDGPEGPRLTEPLALSGV